MKRIILSALIAIGVHVFLLSANFNLPWSSVDLPEIPETLTVVMVSAPMPVKQELPDLQPPPATELLAKAEVVESIPKLPEVIPDVFPADSVVKPKPKKSLKARTFKPQPPPPEPKPEVRPAVQPQLQASTQTPKTASQKKLPLQKPRKELTTVAAVHRPQKFFPDRPAIPMLKQNPPPLYPKSARRRGYQGSVLLKVLVAENGRVEEVEIDKSCGYAILDRTALAAVKEWQFKPGIKDGKKVKMWVKVPVRFELK